MVAYHQRKRLNGTSIPSWSSWDQQRTKRTKVESRIDMYPNAHISLEWDASKNKVVARRAQIAIAQKDLRPFVDHFPWSPTHVGDTFAIPIEIFELDNLCSVLSYEVWQTNLSEKEKDFLLQFLPIGSNKEEILVALLTGKNFHFGNPLLNWGTSLCSGNLHPDAIFHQEKCLRLCKKAYYSEIQKYHNDMITFLQMLKKRWENRRSSVKNVLHEIWRSKSEPETKCLSPSKDLNFCNPQVDDAADTSESCSLDLEEKVCNSDNQDSSFPNAQKRERAREINGDLVSSDSKSRQEGQPDEHRVHDDDATKYMSYLKISKAQYEMVKCMKQSGKSMLFKSLNCVLGNLDAVTVQPYEEFVRDEERKLLDYWLALSSEDIPAAFRSRRERELHKQKLMKSLVDDINGKLSSAAANPNPALLHVRGNVEEEEGVDDDNVDASGRDVWSAFEVPNGHYDSAGIQQCRFYSRSSRSVDVKSKEEEEEEDVEQEEGNSGGLLQRHPDDDDDDDDEDDDDDTSFSLYAGHDRSGLLQSLCFKGEQSQMQRGVMDGGGGADEDDDEHQFAANVRHQILPSSRMDETDISGEGETYFGCGGGFLARRQGQVPLAVQHWPAPSNLDGSLPGNCYSDERRRVFGSWMSSGGAIGNTTPVDQSLFGVLPHCNHLPSYGSLPPSSSDAFLFSRNYGSVVAADDKSTLGNMLPQQMASPMEFLSGRGDPAGSLLAGAGVGWCVVPQNLLDKPYPRPWNP